MTLDRLQIFATEILPQIVISNIQKMKNFITMRGEDLHDAVKDGNTELVAKILQRKETNTEVRGGTQPCLNQKKYNQG